MTVRYGRNPLCSAAGREARNHDADLPAPRFVSAFVKPLTVALAGMALLMSLVLTFYFADEASRASYRVRALETLLAANIAERDALRFERDFALERLTETAAERDEAQSRMNGWSLYWVEHHDAFHASSRPRGPVE